MPTLASKRSLFQILSGATVFFSPLQSRIIAATTPVNPHRYGNPQESDINAAIS
ncbi:hypothetical protein [Neisseria sp. S1]|uniref:hypothetical protein n=1 Tax=Neisseria sp. S1 TaxID=3318354 RepID=UPI003A83E19F